MLEKQKATGIDLKINPKALEHNDAKPNFDLSKFAKNITEAQTEKEVISYGKGGDFLRNGDFLRKSIKI